MELDVLILGGGVAGLWALGELDRAGLRAALLEPGELGAGQTIVAQGIIHGGLKYTLKGLFTRSADAIKEMPGLWRDCLAGRRAPDLSRVRMRGEFCHLWRTASLASLAGMIGAKAGLRVAPTALARGEWPEFLRGAAEVARLDEQVLNPHSLLEELARPYAERVLRYEPGSLRFDKAGDMVREVHLRPPTMGAQPGAASASPSLSLQPRLLVLAAGQGVEDLHRSLGVGDSPMQRRPLHMAVARGDLPVFNGHCVDGMKTRVTITSDSEPGRTTWQLGGQVSEDGVAMAPGELVRHVQAELAATLPLLCLDGLKWTTFRVDRAEPRTAGAKRPEEAYLRKLGNVATAWPVKLVLAPVLASMIRVEAGPAPSATDAADWKDRWRAATVGWPQAKAAQPPWETGTWM